MRWLNSITNSMEMNFSKLQELVENRGNKALLQFAVAKFATVCYSWFATVHRVAKIQTTQLQQICDKGLICRIYKDNCVYTCVVHIYQIHISVCCEVLEAMKPKQQEANLASRSVILFPNKRNQESLQKRLLLGL